MLPHYRPDAINNEAGREKTKRGTSPAEAPADTTASSSKIRIAYLGCVNERGLGVRGGVEKVAPLAREYKFIAKKSLRGGWYYGASLRGFVRIVFKSGAHSARCRGGRRPRDCSAPLPAPHYAPQLSRMHLLRAHFVRTKLPSSSMRLNRSKAQSEKKSDRKDRQYVLATEKEK